MTLPARDFFSRQGEHQKRRTNPLSAMLFALPQAIALCTIFMAWDNTTLFRRSDPPHAKRSRPRKPDRAVFKLDVADHCRSFRRRHLDVALHVHAQLRDEPAGLLRGRAL